MSCVRQLIKLTLFSLKAWGPRYSKQLYPVYWLSSKMCMWSNHVSNLTTGQQLRSKTEKQEAKQQKLSYATAPSVPALSLHYFFNMMHQEAQAALVTNTRAEEGRFILKKKNFVSHPFDELCLPCSLQ